MYEDGEDNNNDNENDYSDEISETNSVDMLDDIDEKEATEQNDGFKIITYKNVVDTIERKKKHFIPILTKFEKARVIGVRLQQLANGAKPRVDTKNLKDIKEIVQEELVQRKIPFIIRRTLPNGTYEDWRMEDFLTV